MDYSLISYLFTAASTSIYALQVREIWSQVLLCPLRPETVVVFFLSLKKIEGFAHFYVSVVCLNDEWALLREVGRILQVRN
jgi:hypothetical protein